MNRQQRKLLVKELLTAGQLPSLVELAVDDRRAVSVLLALLFEQDDRIRWRAIEVLGVIAGEMSVVSLEPVRELLRRLEWLMNDESGGSGWHSPEAIASVVLNVPALIDDFGLLLGSYLTDEPLRRGAHWAVAAVAKVRPDLFSDRVDELMRSLNSADPYVRGYAVIALASLDGEMAAAKMQMLSDDVGTLDLYSRETGELRTTTVGNVVKLLVAANVDAESRIDVW